MTDNAAPLNASPGYRSERAHRDASAQPPCVACRQQSRCATQHLACYDYLIYLRTGKRLRRCRERQPTRAVLTQADLEHA